MFTVAIACLVGPEPQSRSGRLVASLPATMCRRVVEPISRKPHRCWTGDVDTNIPAGVSVHVWLCVYVCMRLVFTHPLRE